MAGQSQKFASAISEAQNIVEAAEKRATELKAQAEQVYQEAHDSGYEAGYQQGRQEAVESGVRLLEDVGAIGDTLANQAATLALAIAKSVIGEHLKVAPETVRKIAIHALQESLVGDSATLVVHPEDREALITVRDELRKVAGGASIAVETDKKMSRGGCVLKTDFGEVDASLEILLDVIASRLGIQPVKKSS